MKNNRRRIFIFLAWIMVIAVFAALLRFSISFAQNQKNLSLVNGAPNRWETIFNDEFDGVKIDPNKWTPCFWYADQGCTTEGDNPMQWFIPENVSLSDGALRLTAHRQPILASNGVTYDYTSGMVSSGRDTSDMLVPPRFSFQYGFVEIRARFEAGAGISPAAWLLPSDHSSLPQIDIMRVRGQEPEAVHMNYLYLAQNGSPQIFAGGWRSGASLAGEWHTYAVDWRPDSITWFLDGVEQRSFTDPSAIPSRPMHLVFSLAAGGDWAGSPDDSSTFPANFEIDYVRIYKQSGDYNYQALADAHVDSLQADQNFGAERILAIDGVPQRIAYLRFDLASLRGSTVRSAWLRVRTSGDGTSGSGNSQAVYQVSSDWSEDTITFNNRPPVDSYIIGVLPVTEPNVTYDIPLDTGEVQKMAGNSISLALVITGGDGVYLYSREFRPFYPQLMISTSENSPILTPTPSVR